MQAKNNFFDPFFIANGQARCFWEVTWMGKTSWDNQYPLLDNVVHQNNILVADMF
jgi:hypothetical protein